MAKTRAQNIRLGIFITISVSVLLLLVGYYTTRQFFEKTDTYYVVFHDLSVSGLEVGSPVKYLGINVGTISDITIDPENVQDIILELSLKPSTPVKEDTRADIISVGITGLKSIEIRAGSNKADPLPVGGYINAGSSMAEEITGKAEVIAQKAERVLNNLQLFTDPENLSKFTDLANQLSSLTRQTERTILGVDSLISENRSTIKLSIENVAEASNTLKNSAEMLNSTVLFVNQLLESDTVTDILVNTRKLTQELSRSDVTAMVENISSVAAETSELLSRLNRDYDMKSEELNRNLRLLRETLDNLNDASKKINQDPSILIRGINDKGAPDKDLN